MNKHLRCPARPLRNQLPGRALLVIVVFLAAPGRARRGGTNQDGTGQGAVSSRAVPPYGPGERMMSEVPWWGMSSRASGYVLFYA